MKTVECGFDFDDETRTVVAENEVDAKVMWHAIRAYLPEKIKFLDSDLVAELSLREIKVGEPLNEVLIRIDDPDRLITRKAGDCDPGVAWLTEDDSTVWGTCKVVLQYTHHGSTQQRLVLPEIEGEVRYYTVGNTLHFLLKPNW